MLLVAIAMKLFHLCCNLLNGKVKMDFFIIGYTVFPNRNLCWLVGSLQNKIKQQLIRLFRP